jgi:hypothetical protein
MRKRHSPVSLAVSFTSGSYSSNEIPENNSKQGAPNVPGLIPRKEDKNGGNRAAECISFYVTLAINSLALAAQVTGFVVWPLLEVQDKPQLWILPVAITFISCGWWENYYVAGKNSGKHRKVKYPVAYSYNKFDAWKKSNH